jgi:hypothetical protein
LAGNNLLEAILAKSAEQMNKAPASPKQFLPIQINKSFIMNTLKNPTPIGKSDRTRPNGSKTG